MDSGHKIVPGENGSLQGALQQNLNQSLLVCLTRPHFSATAATIRNLLTQVVSSDHARLIHRRSLAETPFGSLRFLI